MVSFVLYIYESRLGTSTEGRIDQVVAMMTDEYA